MKLNLQKIADFLVRQNLMDKPFSRFAADDINGFFDVVFESLEEPPDGWTPPYETEQHELVIPFNAPLKYRWWQGGQPIMQTLLEIGASDELKRKYTPVSEGTSKDA